MKTKRKAGLIHDLLTENRYWTFWSADWSKRVNIFWGGTIKWGDILETMRLKLGDDFGFERQVELKNPDIKFA